MDYRLIALITHLIGFALGLGGATFSDILFFKMLRGGKLDSAQLNILRTISKIVWMGLWVLIISGLSIFALIYAEQGSLPMLASPRWQAKLTLVAIVLLNGFAFKKFIFPFLGRSAGQLVTPQLFSPNLWKLAIIGSISIVSWYSILIISALPREFRPSYYYFIGVYLLIVICGTFVGKFLLKKIIK